MPPGGADGLTKDQLTSLANDIGLSDSAASSSIKNVVNSFDKADANGDGKVSLKEMMAYKQQTESSSESSSSSSTSSSTSNSDLNANLMSQVAKLMHAYNIGGDQISSLLSTISVSA